MHVCTQAPHAPAGQDGEWQLLAPLAEGAADQTPHPLVTFCEVPTALPQAPHAPAGQGGRHQPPGAAGWRSCQYIPHESNKDSFQRRHHTHRQAKAASTSRWRRWLEQLPMMYPTALTPILIGLIVGIMVRLLV